MTMYDHRAILLPFRNRRVQLIHFRSRNRSRCASESSRLSLSDWRSASRRELERDPSRASHGEKRPERAANAKRKEKHQQPQPRHLEPHPLNGTANERTNAHSPRLPHGLTSLSMDHDPDAEQGECQPLAHSQSPESAAALTSADNAARSSRLRREVIAFTSGVLLCLFISCAVILSVSRGSTTIPAVSPLATAARSQPTGLDVAIDVARCEAAAPATTRTTATETETATPATATDVATPSLSPSCPPPTPPQPPSPPSFLVSSLSRSFGRVLLPHSDRPVSRPEAADPSIAYPRATCDAERLFSDAVAFEEYYRLCKEEDDDWDAHITREMFTFTEPEEIRPNLRATNPHCCQTIYEERRCAVYNDLMPSIEDSIAYVKSTFPPDRPYLSDVQWQKGIGNQWQLLFQIHEQVVYILDEPNWDAPRVRSMLYLVRDLVERDAEPWPNMIFRVHLGDSPPPMGGPDPPIFFCMSTDWTIANGGCVLFPDWTWNSWVHVFSDLRRQHNEITAASAAHPFMERDFRWHFSAANPATGRHGWWRNQVWEIQKGHDNLMDTSVMIWHKPGHPQTPKPLSLTAGHAILGDVHGIGYSGRTKQLLHSGAVLMRPKPRFEEFFESVFKAEHSWVQLGGSYRIDFPSEAEFRKQFLDDLVPIMEEVIAMKQACVAEAADVAQNATGAGAEPSVNCRPLRVNYGGSSDESSGPTPVAKMPPSATGFPTSRVAPAPAPVAPSKAIADDAVTVPLVTRSGGPFSFKSQEPIVPPETAYERHSPAWLERMAWRQGRLADFYVNKRAMACYFRQLLRAYASLLPPSPNSHDELRTDRKPKPVSAAS